MQLLTSKQLAEALQVSEYTIKRWVRLGMIPKIKMENTTRFNLDEVVTHMKKE